MAIGRVRKNGDKLIRPCPACVSYCIYSRAVYEHVYYGVKTVYTEVKTRACSSLTQGHVCDTKACSSETTGDHVYHVIPLAKLTTYDDRFLECT